MRTIRDRVAVFEQSGNDPWNRRDSELYHALTEPGPESSTRLIFTDSEPLEGPIPINFPEGFSSILNDDLNGSFFCDYIASDDDDDKIVRHISWTCFKVKMVLKPKEYRWVQASLVIDWTMADNRQTVLVLNLPEPQQLQIQHKLPQIKARLNPFRWHMEFSSTLITLYDASIWSLRDLVRAIEKARDKPNHPPPDFPHLHDIGRHIFHSTETLEIAENTVKNLVDEQARWRDEFPESRQKGRGVYLHTQQRLYSLSKQLHSLKTRSRSLTERLHNEINLAFNIVSQRYGRDAQSDSAMMKTVGVVSLVYLPGTFVSGLFGTNFFDFAPGDDSDWKTASTFWMYWAVTIPLTLVTVVIWALWHWRALLRVWWEGRRRGRGRKEKEGGV
ncbi:hypothetical protein P170DRAFT_504932 [Aspergillus steynii IBT 23096]|uniref:Uncharacterized protein n=1 Tax=Aspergillus steynii IBT 23096 TaxID=1392250 RepID=A0A2I2GMN0_9EURO|nr:uncharacterized protein P170DRAFT_504932 [Aspergillus steynii IBT 23096]PLB54124.1 hypothetical protein P170DRAFT_504932 [Aspergillus steynii IBT 23096]